MLLRKVSHPGSPVRGHPRAFETQRGRGRGSSGGEKSGFMSEGSERGAWVHGTDR